MLIWLLGWEDPLEKEMMTTPVSLPGKFHGQRSWWATVHGVTESDKTEQTCMHTCSLYTHFVESFYHNWVLNLVKSSFCIYWGDYMIFVLQFISVVYCILICGYWTTLDIASLGQIPLDWKVCPFNVLLKSVCWYVIEDFCDCVHQWYWHVVLCVCVCVCVYLVWFWYQGDSGLMESSKAFLPLCFCFCFWKFQL